MNPRPPDSTAQEIEEAYAAHGDGLFRFALRLGAGRDDAEDIVVETFAQAYRHWDAYRGKGSRRAWLYGIAANRFRMGRRRDRNAPEPLPDDLPQTGPDAMELIALETEIAKLPERRRAAFLLVKGEGLTAREAAEALGRPVGTILYEVHRAVMALRDALGDGPAPCPRPALHQEVER